jgi:hypothetical protein
MNSDAKQEIDSLIEITAETVVDITDKYNADSQIVIERLLRRLGFITGVGGFKLEELIVSLSEGFEQGERLMIGELEDRFGIAGDR